MSWLFSKALMEAYENSLSSQVPAGEYSAENCLDGEPSAQLNVMPTQHKFWRNDKTMDVLSLSRFGLTFAVLTESHGEGLLTWFREDFLVKTLVQQVKEQELRENAQDFGNKWQELSVRYDRISSSWKTHHCLWEEVLPWSSVTLPRKGMIRNGILYQAKMLAEFTYESGAGLKLHTPCASDITCRNSPKNVHICKSGLPKLINSKGQKSQVQLSQSLKIPTIGANEMEGAGKNRFIGSPDFRGAKMSEGLRTCEQDQTYLNPLFAELVMMWPLGWTDLKPLVMDKFQEWQQQHGRFFQEDEQ